MIEINLIKQKEAFRVPLILGLDFNIIKWRLVIVCYVLSKLPGWIIFPMWEQNIVEKEEENAVLEKELAKLTSEIRKNDDVVKQLDLYNKQVDRLNLRGAQVEQIIKTKTNPKKLLEKIARDIPTDLWLESVSIENNMTISITGGTDSYRSIGDFIISLNQSAFFGNSIEIGETRTVEEQVGTQGINRIEVFNLSGRIQTYDPWVM